jgi:[ribosomal protein S5]-alanine N-acetyltransferase
VSELQRLHADHAQAVLAFELANRAYFATFISDRGDTFFDHFTERYTILLAEQAAGIGAFYVLVAEDGSVLGRFNLTFTGDDTAELGYRVAQHVAGRGVATETVRELCRLAVERHGLRTLKAAVSTANIASQKVLIKSGFVEIGPADPSHIGGKPGSWYQLDLVPRHE